MKFFKKKRTSGLPKGHDSKLEVDVHDLIQTLEWKPDKIPYVMTKEYNPDAKIGKYYVEIKGRFRTSDEARKYLFIRDHLPKDAELVFIFSKGSVPMPGAKRRKDGTKYTMAEWAEQHGFEWIDLNELRHVCRQLNRR